MSKEKMEVATKTQFTLDKVPDMLEVVNAKIKELKGEQQSSVKITEELGPFGVVSSITDVNVLRQAYAYITRKEQAFNDTEVAEVFDNIDPTAPKMVFTEAGHSAETWKKEIVRQAKQSTFQTQLDKLEKAKKILTENLSAEQKFVASMADIADLFQYK